jgi:hypothetical protein
VHCLTATQQYKFLFKLSTSNVCCPGTSCASVTNRGLADIAAQPTGVSANTLLDQYGFPLCVPNCSVQVN